MDAPAELPADDAAHLRRCLNDLVSLLALPAMWSGAEPARIIDTLPDALLGMLDLDLVYMRSHDAADGRSNEAMRVAGARSGSVTPFAVDALLRQFGSTPQEWPSVVRTEMAGEAITLVTLPMGFHGEAGAIVAGSSRSDFPRQTESLVLNVAANQAAIGLQEARLLSAERRVASELDQRVGMGAAELAAAGEELRKQAESRDRAERDLRAVETTFRQIVDGIPGLVCTMSPTGRIELISQRILEYFGRTPEELRLWAFNDAVHPDDRARVIAAFSHSIATGEVYDIEHRCRRADGVYRWFQVKGHPVRDATDRVTGWYVLLVDIEDRKRAEDDIRSSERNLNQIINTIPALAWSARPDGSAEFFNQHYLDYVGLSAEEARDWGWTIAVHPDDLDRLIAGWREMAASGSPGESESRLRRFDGEYRWFLLRAHPLRDADGRIVKWYGVNTDIEDRKRAEDKARLIIDTALDAVIAMNAQGIVTSWNTQAEATFGWSPAEAIGRRMSDLIIPPAQRVAHERGLRRFLETGDGPILRRRLEVMALRRGGAEFPVELEVVPMRVGPEWVFSAFIRDITDSKLAEAKIRESELNLRQMTETIPEMLWSATPEGAIDYCNARLLDYTGVSARDIMGTGWLKLLHPDDVDQTTRVWQSSVATGAPYRVEMRAFHAADRTYRWCTARARPLLGPDGAILRWHGTVVDMHDWRQAQEELRHMQEELAHATRVMAMGTLTASIAHEVNQPLSGIVTNAGTCLRMLAADPPDIAGARETARRTIRDGNRAAEVIARLRALFVRKGGAAEWVDVNEATREVVELTLSELERNRVALRLELADNLPLIAGDRVQLQQVILNLIRNASDAMRTVNDRPRRLFVRTSQGDDRSVHVAVQDAGSGFDPQSVEKLFEAFYTTKSDGMGMGLSISRSIVENHHGRLWAESNDGPGATFIFSIPVSAGPEQAR